MSCIHFKFKSSLEYDKFTFDGLQVSVAELKEGIMRQKKIGASNVFKLKIIDAQSKKEYENDSEVLPRNTSVIVHRVPIPNAAKLPKTQHKDPTLAPTQPLSDKPAFLSAKMTHDELKQTADLAGANATEEEKVLAMISQAGQGFDPSQYVKYPSGGHYRGGGGGGGGRGGGAIPAGMKNPPPPNYTCFRCGQRGHWIQLCPTNGDKSFDNYRFKRSMGTPSNQILSVSTNMPGTMLDRHGNRVIRLVDYQAMVESKQKGKQHQEAASGSEESKELQTPPELICQLCKELVRDAVIIQCCGESFCYECIQEHLLENDFTCPMCKTTDVSPETLAPNKALRTSAKNFQLKAAEAKSVAMARGFVPKVIPPNKIFVMPTTSAKKVLDALVKSAAATTSVTPSQAAAPITPSQPATVTPSPAAPITTDTKSDASNESERQSNAHPSITVDKLSETSTAIPQSSPNGSQEKSKKSEDVNKSSEETPATTSAATDSEKGTSIKPDAEKTDCVALPSSAQDRSGDKSAAGTLTVSSGGAGKPWRSRSPSPRSRSVSPLPPNIKDSFSTKPNPAAFLLKNALATSGGHLLPGLIPAAATGLGRPLLPGNLLNPGLVPGGLGTAGLVDSASKSSNSAKLERIAAELLLSGATATAKRKAASPPPLSAQEFYRQQRMLKQLTRTQRSSSSSSFRSPSRSRTPLSDYSSDWSGSSTGNRSRSRSPYAHSKGRSIRTRHHRRAENFERSSREKERERDSRRREKDVKHHKRKRQRDESPSRTRDRESKRSRRNRSRSPGKPQRPRGEGVVVDSLPDVISPDATTTATSATSETDHRSSSRRHSKHKKRSKHRHKNIEREGGDRGEGKQIGEGVEPSITTPLLAEPSPPSSEEPTVSLPVVALSSSQELTTRTEESVDAAAMDTGPASAECVSTDASNEVGVGAEGRASVLQDDISCEPPKVSILVEDDELLDEEDGLDRTLTDVAKEPLSKPTATSSLEPSAGDKNVKKDKLTVPALVPYLDSPATEAEQSVDSQYPDSDSETLEEGRMVSKVTVVAPAAAAAAEVKGRGALRLSSVDDEMISLHTEETIDGDDDALDSECDAVKLMRNGMEEGEISGEESDTGGGGRRGGTTKIRLKTLLSSRKPPLALSPSKNSKTTGLKKPYNIPGSSSSSGGGHRAEHRHHHSSKHRKTHRTDKTKALAKTGLVSIDNEEGAAVVGGEEERGGKKSKKAKKHRRSSKDHHHSRHREREGGEGGHRRKSKEERRSQDKHTREKAKRAKKLSSRSEHSAKH